MSYIKCKRSLLNFNEKVVWFLLEYPKNINKLDLKKLKTLQIYIEFAPTWNYEILKKFCEMGINLNYTG